MNDYNEPWVVTEEDYILTGIVDSGGSPIIPHTSEEAIERIVACVNFCKGFNNASLENMKSLVNLRASYESYQGAKHND